MLLIMNVLCNFVDDTFACRYVSDSLAESNCVKSHSLHAFFVSVGTTIKICAKAGTMHSVPAPQTSLHQAKTPPPSTPPPLGSVTHCTYTFDAQSQGAGNVNLVGVAQG